MCKTQVILDGFKLQKFEKKTSMVRETPAPSMKASWQMPFKILHIFLGKPPLGKQKSLKP